MDTSEELINDEDYEDGIYHTSTYQGPSRSWTSINDEISCKEFSRHRKLCKVVSINYDLVDVKAPFGAVKAPAVLNIEANALTVEWQHTSWTEVAKVNKFAWTTLDEEDWESCYSEDVVSDSEDEISCSEDEINSRPRKKRRVDPKRKRVDRWITLQLDAQEHTLLWCNLVLVAIDSGINDNGDEGQVRGIALFQDEDHEDQKND